MELPIGMEDRQRQGTHVFKDTIWLDLHRSNAATEHGTQHILRANQSFVINPPYLMVDWKRVTVLGNNR